MDKQAARKKIRELKKAATPEEKQQESEAVWSELEQTEAFAKARVILTYWSMEDEVRTHDFISRWAGKKCFLLPCVKGDTLELRRFDGREKLSPGESFAIPEPAGRLWEEPSAIDLIIVPGVAFDKKGNRLGRGKGYYDRILKTSTAYKIGVCFSFQLWGSVPVEAHDIPMDYVIAGN
ncbi:MAG: 5-formyltetrahydrofolate cyclo-ligase [Culturomica sp.]|jgi:5-formyltetrahydrofolate cyclo-ligase|nr:5-formyltetrahydrofolate cyclo-ligase [Culturomica sp.]